MNTKRKGGLWRALGALLACALALGLSGPGPALAAAAGAGQLPDCTLRLTLPTGTDGKPLYEDLDADAPQADLYRIAPAVPLAGYDVYGYCVDNQMGWYAAVREFLEAHAESWHTETLHAAPAGYAGSAGATEWLLFRYTPEEQDPEELLALENALAAYILSEEADEKPAATAAVGAKSGAVGAGLYLTVVHERGAAKEDYTVYRADGAGAYYTVAATARYQYTFQPQLISLPGLVREGKPVTDTAAGGTWQSDVAAVVKCSRTPRTADLEIEKSLTTFTDPVTFVFRIVAYDPENGGRKVYEKVLPLSFDGAGEKTGALITGEIPVGSTVVVTEEYAGAGYGFDGGTAFVTPAGTALDVTADAARRSVTVRDIPAGRLRLTASGEGTETDGATVTVRFTNSHTTTDGDGGSVVNRFDKNAAGWTFSRRRYDPETGTWVTETPVPVTKSEEG